jgi:hypothetical protein
MQYRACNVHQELSKKQCSRSKLKLASAEVLIQQVMNEGEKEGKAYARTTYRQKKQYLNCFSLPWNISANERTEQ